MEEQIKKIYEKQKNGRIRMIRNVLLIYVALIGIVSIFKGIHFHQETVLFQCENSQADHNRFYLSMGLCGA